jgi:hypothetical protein
MDEARRRQIMRDLDDDLERRIAARTYRPEPKAQPVEQARPAAETKELHDRAWTIWASSLVDSKLEEFARGTGAALAKVRGEFKAAIDTAKTEVLEQVRIEMAAAIEAARNEFKTSIGVAVRQEIAAPLRELRREIEDGATPRALGAPAEPRPLLALMPPIGEA